MQNCLLKSVNAVVATNKFNMNALIIKHNNETIFFITVVNCIIRIQL